MNIEMMILFHALLHIAPWPSLLCADKGDLSCLLNVNWPCGTFVYTPEVPTSYESSSILKMTNKKV